jgi:3'(2'), 5'-bisphosphate nucleotidase
MIGSISLTQLRKAMGTVTVAATICGVLAIYMCLGSNLQALAWFAFLGVFAILAAIFYTIGFAYGYKGFGAYVDNDNGKGIRLNVSDNVDKTALRMVMSSSHGDERVDSLVEKYNIKDHVSMGSSLKGCIIASGEADIYYRYKPTMEWDTAAMQLIVEEAGGIFRQTDDSEMLYNRENSVNEIGFYILNSIENKLSL